MNILQTVLKAVELPAGVAHLGARLTMFWIVNIIIIVIKILIKTIIIIFIIIWILADLANVD